MLSKKLARSALFSVLLLGLTTVSGWARECSLETLNGTYGLFVQGTIVVTSPQFPFVASGVFTYDGKGNVSGTYNQSVGGGIATGLKAVGTYDVASDCTYSATLNTASGVGHRVGTITGEGMQQEIHILYTDPISVASGTLKKTPQGGCSLKTLNGTYALFGEGTIFPPSPPAILHDTVGALTFDGAGNFFGSDTANLNGNSVPVTFEGTYAVTPECATSVEIHLTSGPTAGTLLHEAGSVTGEGVSKEIHDIFTTPGWVVTDTLKKQ